MRLGYSGIGLFALAVFFQNGRCEDIADEEPVATPPTPVAKLIDFTAPNTNGLEFVETFQDGNVFNRWVKSENPKFTGAWAQKARKSEAVRGDLGLRLENEAQHHGIAASLNTAQFRDNAGKHTVISYEAKFEDGLTCGGSYLKLFDTQNLKEGKFSAFDNETPYVVMFGPDKCGVTNKVHVIIKVKNPVSGEWIEHHLKEPPKVPSDSIGHHYALHLSPDNQYAVYVDGKISKQGSMMEDFQPPFQPPTEIPDPEDKKPETWVDEKKIPDPNAVKPEDWDEDAPMMIPDEAAVMPEGWMLDEPAMIPDPSATQPEDWDEEEDGPWAAPNVPNPACASAPGCGPWQRPQIRNPEFKGKWRAPMIDNPDYIGEWQPRKIPNPHYYEGVVPHALASFDGVGFELWTMSSGIMFDNIVVSRNMDAVQKFVESTWSPRAAIEKDLEAVEKAKAMEESEKMLKEKMGESDAAATTRKLMDSVHMLASEYPMLFFVGASGSILAIIVVMSTMFRRKPVPTPDAKDAPIERKKSSAALSDAEDEKSKKAQRKSSQGSADSPKEGGVRQRAKKTEQQD